MDFKKYAVIKELSGQRRLPRLGKIRLGLKALSQSGKEYPKEVDYFVCPPEVQKIYGEMPKELDVMVPINNVETVFPQAYKLYGKNRGLKCIGNGTTAMRLNEKTQTMEERECPCELMGKPGGCSLKAHLMVILPKVSIGGIYQIDVGSINSVIDINSGLAYVEALVGRFAMVPLKLRRAAKETYANGVKSVHYPLQIFLDADLGMLNALREDTKRILIASSSIALPAPDAGLASDDDGDISEAVVDMDPEPPESPKSYVLESQKAVFEPPKQEPPKQEPPKPEPKSMEKPKAPAAHDSASGGQLSSTQQQAAIVSLATKAGVNADTVMSFLSGLTQEKARAVIIALQHGDTTMFLNDMGRAA
jgi:hypothetical protein